MSPRVYSAYFFLLKDQANAQKYLGNRNRSPKLRPNHKQQNLRIEANTAKNGKVTIKLPTDEYLILPAAANHSRVRFVEIFRDQGEYKCRVVASHYIKQRPLDPEKSIGIDFGVRRIVGSNAQVWTNSKSTLKTIRRLERTTDRNLIRRLKSKLVTQLRTDYTNIAKQIAAQFDYAFIELPISLPSAKTFIEILKREMTKVSGKCIVVTPNQNSQKCSKCGSELVDATTQIVTCKKCKTKIDRDVNAAINILMRGREKLSTADTPRRASQLGSPARKKRKSTRSTTTE